MSISLLPNKTRTYILAWLLCVVFCHLAGTGGMISAAELRFVGVLGNSGEGGETLVSFAGQTAAGMGPVIDDEMTIWERGGSKQLNRYALDGRLLASFRLPESTDRSDQMTRAGNVLLMRLRKQLYSLPLDARAGSQPVSLAGKFDVISSNAFDGRVVFFEKDQDRLGWFDPLSGKRTEIAKHGFGVQSLHVGDDGAVYAFGGNQVYSWKDGLAVDGFPKDFRGERPQKIGRYWYSHSWHGTINRVNEHFEPDPGVVLGGASGSFIGYLPQSVDITNGRGLVHVRDNIFAVSGINGVVQLLVWNNDEVRFEVARRIGALHELTGVAIDAVGNIWTPRGSMRWDDSCEVPFTLGDKEPDTHAQPVVLNGRTLCLLKKHYSYTQLINGPFIDASGWSHFEQKGISKFDLPQTVTGAAAVPDGKGLKMIVAEQNGKAFQLGITSNGQPRSKPEPVTIAGLIDCTSLAWFDGRLLAADGGTIIAFEPDGQRAWKEAGRLATFTGDAFVHSDGKWLVISDVAGGAVHVFRSSKSSQDLIPYASYAGLQLPTHVAISDRRVVVYESGRQRLVKLQLNAAQRSRREKKSVAVSKESFETDKAPHNDVDFQNIGRPGGIPLAVAVTQVGNSLFVSLRVPADPAPTVTLGVANARQAIKVRRQLTESQNSRGLARFAESSEQNVPVPFSPNSFGIGSESQPVATVSFRFPLRVASLLRLAVSVELPNQRERFGFDDDRAIHAPFSDDAADWARFDLSDYNEQLASRLQAIRISFDQPTDGKASVVIEDADGYRVRNLVSGRAFTAGRHTLVWDGLDESGKLVTPGSYRWRGITHPGIEPIYKMNFANGGEDTVAPWGPNHSPFHDAASNGKLVFFAAPVTEGGWALVALDADGKFVQGYEHLHGSGIGHNAIAADDKFLYCAQDGFAWGGTKDVDLGSDTWKATWKLTIVRYDIASGKLVEFPGKQRAIEVDTMEVGPGAGHPDLKDFNLGGLAVLDGKLYVGSRAEQAVLVLDAETGKRLESIPAAGVRHLTARTEIYAATDNGIVRLRDGKVVVRSANETPASSTAALRSQSEQRLAGIAVAPNGEIVVSDGASHQIHRYTPEGKRVGTIGTPGGPYKGVYDPRRMVNPAGLVFGPGGKLWVTENRWNPKRILAWDVERNDVVYEKFGMPHYGGDGSGFDPENPRRWIGLGCFWDVDIERGTARPTHILSLREGHFGNYEPHSYLFFRQAGRTFVCARGKISLISEVLPDGTLHDLAAVAGTHHFGYGCRWDPPQAYIDAFYAKWPEKRASERPGRKGKGKPWSQRGMGVLWVDRNGDARTQQEEFDFCGDELQFGGGAWGHLQTSLTLYMPVVENEQVKIVAIEPRGFLPNGVPDYPTLDEAIAQATPVDMTPGYKRSGVATVRDRFGRFIFNSDPEMNAYAVGRNADSVRTDWQPVPHAWTYPNQWSDVHGSHNAPLPEPGVMQGTMGILGLAPLDGTSDVFFLNGNHGRCFLLTTDGIYLDEAFVDVRVSYLKNEYRLGGEIFGGSFGRSATDGKYYVQIGHGPYRIYELTGLSDAQRIAGAIVVSKEQILAAEQQNLRRVAEKQIAMKASVPGTLRWDKSGKFRVEVDLKADATHLHLHYRVQDASPWINNGRDWTKLFATGDSVDLQIATNPQASPKRQSPVEGDKRLLIAPFEGQPIAVLYEHRKPGGKTPIEFTSPWRGVKVDNVQRLVRAKIDVETSNGGYEVKVSVPLSDLGFAPKNGPAYRADFGATFGDADGTDTNLRSYWSNQSTGLVDDIPGEIMLSPNLWGEIRFQSPEANE